MTSKLLSYLKYELQLLEEMVSLAESLRTSLTKWQLEEIEPLTTRNTKLALALRKAGEARLTIISAWLKIAKSRASEIKFSQLAKYFDGEEKRIYFQLRSDLKTSIDRLNALNATNRILTNRARRTNAQLFEIVTRGKNTICNKRV